jgi:hypothetical protein
VCHISGMREIFNDQIRHKMLGCASWDFLLVFGAGFLDNVPDFGFSRSLSRSKFAPFFFCAGFGQCSENFFLAYEI